jgi:protein O-GlcNAc transferase
MNIALAEQPHDSLGVDEIFKMAINCHQSDQLAQAEELYLSILKVNPKHPDTNYNLGLMAMQLGKSEMGLPYLQTAWESDPSIGQYWLTLTECLLEMGNAEEALMVIEDAITRGIDSPQAVSLLMQAKSNHEQKTQEVRINKDKNDGSSVVNLEQDSLGYKQMFRDFSPSTSDVNKTAQKSKPNLEKSNNLSIKTDSHHRKKPNLQEEKKLATLFSEGRFVEAESLAQEMVSCYPKYAFGWKVLGTLLSNSGRALDALMPMQKVTSLTPDDAEAHYNLGVIFKDLGSLKESELSLQHAIKIRPNYAMAHNNLGVILKEMKRLKEAETSLRRALQILPDYADAHGNLASILSSLGNRDEAETHFRRAIEIRPDDADAYSNLLFSLSEKEGISAEILFAEHCRFGEQCEGPLRGDWPQHENLRDPDKCLKVGFVSGDFCNHAVASFIEPVLIQLTNYPKLSLYAYSNVKIEDETTSRLRECFHHWDSISGLSDIGLADKIRADKIDILMDLSGHTEGNRLLTFARKPAPVQVSWVGYPGTSGLKSIDYFLADRYFLPPGKFDNRFTEKIVYVPAKVAISPYEFAPPINMLPAINNGYITFGSFNRLSKLNPSVIALWARLLRALPDSRILLGGMPQDGESDVLIDLFAREGITSDRLNLHPRTSVKNYLDLHHQVDICLDTFPYAGSTTTFHAMWMGVPTLTLNSATLAGRGSACILGHVGLGEFIADDKDDFVRKGVSWQANLAALSTLRSDLRARFKKSAIGQPETVTTTLNLALRAMWKNWCADLPVESFEVSRNDVDNVMRQLDKEVMESKRELSPIYVTQPLLPPLEEFIPYLQQIWDSKKLTNGGPFHQQLEQALCNHLGVKHISLFTNGTLALMTAMQALRITGEVITTPYSFVATAHSLLWNGIKPVFVDIDPVTLNLDPSKIEAAITPQTTAIMPVHCYGHPCDVKAIQNIADNYGLKVIYDAAHAFGVQCPNGSILNHGDMSVLSFHATKVFNTFEGGAIVCHDAKTKQRIDHLKNFGFVDEVTVVAAGINGKMSEVNAAFGMLQLKRIDEALETRKAIDTRYREGLAGVIGIDCLSETIETVANYAYFPILVSQDYPLSRDELYQKMRDSGVYARRYFYPLVSDFPMYRGMPSAAHSNLPVAKKVAEQVICLPIYPDLCTEQVNFIIQLITGGLEKA